MAKLSNYLPACVALPATVPHPADYPLGSLQSRAAVRAWLDELDQVRPRMYITFRGLGGPGEQPSIGECPQPKPDGTIVVLVHLRTGWTRQQWEQFLAQQPRQKQREWEAFLEDDKMQPAPLISAAPKGGPS